MPFGQLVVGPPGSGKSTYCNGLQQYLSALGRKVAVINLDPANDAVPYDCAVDIMDLVSLEEVMRETKLGPNGGLVYCMEYLQNNFDWLQQKLQSLEKDDCYVIFDCPGQVELFTLHDCLQKTVQTLTNKLGYRLAAVHLIDAHICSDASKYVAALLLSLNIMLSLELPHINVLSKMDLIESYGKLAFNLDFFTEVQDLSFVVDSMGEDLFSKRFKKLTEGLCGIVEDFSMVRFVPLAIEDKESVRRVVALVDKATGYVFTGLAGGLYPPEFTYGAGVTDDASTSTLMAYEERYMKAKSQASTDADRDCPE